MTRIWTGIKSNDVNDPENWDDQPYYGSVSFDALDDSQVQDLSKFVTAIIPMTLDENGRWVLIENEPIIVKAKS